MARIAKSLDTLRSQVNAAYPTRSKVSDGWIGDAKHAASKSDHNPNSAGVVTAFDVTHDPANGLDSGKLADTLVASRDPRIKYVISNKRICASYATGGSPPWTWRPYSGSNAHTKHVHVSVMGDAARYDDPGPWVIVSLAPVPPRPAPPAPPSTSLQRRRMAEAIMDYEARTDAQGRLMVYTAGDGSREIAGINERSHPDEFESLEGMLVRGDYEAAEEEVLEYILEYTEIAVAWTKDAGVEFYLRDCVFNRGPRGAAIILQKALDVDEDGVVGEATLAAASAADQLQLLTKMREARETYEKQKYGYRASLWPGLVNRWDAALALARQFHGEQETLEVATDTGVSGGGGGIMFGLLAWLDVPLSAAGITAVISAVLVFLILRRGRGQGVAWIIVGGLAVAALFSIVTSILTEMKK